jgi:hypothetical protein
MQPTRRGCKEESRAYLTFSLVPRLDSSPLPSRDLRQSLRQRLEESIPIPVIQQ